MDWLYLRANRWWSRARGRQVGMRWRLEMLRGTSRAARTLLCNLAMIALALTCTACGGWVALGCQIPPGPAHVGEADVLGTWRGPDGARFILLPGGRLRFEQVPTGDWGSAFATGTLWSSGTGEWYLSADVNDQSVQLHTGPEDGPFLMELFTTGTHELELAYFRGDPDECRVQRFTR
jgi:hypothetical protein